MGNWGYLLVAVVSLSLLSCNNGDEDSYKGPAPLTESQKKKTQDNVNKTEKIQRALEAVTAGTAPAKDILNIVDILERCDVDNDGAVGGGYFIGSIMLKGSTCPVNFKKTYQYKVKKVDNNYEIVSGHDEFIYTTGFKPILNLIDAKRIQLRVDRKSEDNYSMRAQFQFRSIGMMIITDTMDKTASGPFYIYNFFRRINFSGVLVEARVILKINHLSDELVELDLFLNGQRIEADEMESIFPLAFDWFSNGRQFPSPIPKQN